MLERVTPEGWLSKEHLIMGASSCKPKHQLALLVEYLNIRNIYLEDSSGILNVEAELRIRVLGTSPGFSQLRDMKQVSEPVCPLL